MNIEIREGSPEFGDRFFFISLDGACVGFVKVYTQDGKRVGESSPYCDIIPGYRFMEVTAIVHRCLLRTATDMILSVLLEKEGKP